MGQLVAPALFLAFALAAATACQKHLVTPGVHEPKSEVLEDGQRAADTRFDAKISPVLEVRRTRSGHTLVHPLVDGQDLGWFVFDSGAGGMVIDRAAADRIAMPVLDNIQVIGIGSAESSRLRQGKHFTLGPMAIDDLKFVELDLAGLSGILGVPIGGIVGFDLIARAVVELDVATPAASIHDPEAYELTRGTWQAVQFSNNHPVVTARFEGDREDSFVLDTGSNDTVIFHAPTVERYKLLERRETTARRGRGIAGAVVHQRGVLEWFEFGGHRFEQVRVSFHTNPDAAADIRLAGNIGSRIFSRFVMVFDYSRERMAFVARGEAAQ
jgi:hypothetical protein